MEYNSSEIQKKWQDYWQEKDIYKVENDTSLPKYYVLDMFPYPSGSGLHVGHPLGYIASDIFSRYKRLKGFNVLHPMGFDAFGLPAEQYAIQERKHPTTTTKENIATYKSQLNNLGMSYDWSREVITSDPKYFKWTQWIFLQLFNSYYNNEADKAEPIENLINHFSQKGTEGINVAHSDDLSFTAEEWNAFSQDDKEKTLQNYRLAYQAYSEIWYCPELGTVLANDEVKDGVSERGGFPVEKRRLRQWFLRVTAYADRLLSGLDTVDYSESMKEMQRNWIGKSYGASITFDVKDHDGEVVEVFTTRPDTIFGVTFMVLAPEHELVQKITTADQKDDIEKYLDYVNKRSDRERMSEVKVVTGAFTGSYAVHPFTKELIPIWIGEYVLIGYGTGAIMAVPADDDRDNAFADKFGVPIVEIIDKSAYPNAGREDKLGKMINSDFVNGMEVVDAIQEVNKRLEKDGIGKAKVNYRLRDAGYSRQRYWGEPFPIVYKTDGDEAVAYALSEDQLPVELPMVDSYAPTGDGKSPLSAIDSWVKLEDGTFRETDTMPGYAGSSWYFLRYMDPNNDDAFISKEAIDYWQEVDFYIGGTEHAVGHLLYSRMWHKFFYDKGIVPTEEPYKKLVNQGMIQGTIEYLYLNKEKKDGNSHFICAKMLAKKGIDQENISKIPVLIDFVEDYGQDDSYLNISSIKKFIDWRPEYENAIFECSKGIFQNGVFTPADPANEDNHLYTESEVGKISKSKHNVINPDDMVDKYGTDCFRMYEMFLGPIEQSKPWDTKGISGVAKFLRKFHGLFFKGEQFVVSDETPTDEEYKILHKTIKKIEDDLNRFSLNTCVSTFMVAANDLSSKKCNKRAILEPLTVLLAPFAPFLTEDLWHRFEERPENSSVHKHASYPVLDEKYLKEDAYEYPIMIKGKPRAKIKLGLDLEEAAVKEIVLADEAVQKWIDGGNVKRFVYVKGKIVNIVV